MAEEIANSVSKLRIDDEEDQVLDIESLNPNLENKVSLLLIGKLLTERSYNVDAFKRTITTVWAPKHGLVIRTLKPNLYAFQFYHWRDLAKVMEGRPWCFDNMLVLLKEADGDEQPDQVNLQHSPFWIRLKNLPFNMRSDDVVKALIGNMGEILDMEEDALGIGRYRRVKVMLDVSNPLRRYRKVRDRKGQELQVDFAYERLPFFCLACGVMGHAEKDCQFVLDEDKNEGMGWHLGLKATPRKGRSKELEEEIKFKNCRKVLFEKKENDLEPVQLEAINAPANNPCTESKEFNALVSVPINTDNAREVGQVCLLKDNTTRLEYPTHQHEDPPPIHDTFAEPTPQNKTFVFASVKEVKVNKQKAWKRLARGPMIDKGEFQQMELDHECVDNKRTQDIATMEGDSADSAMKRPKLSESTTNAPVYMAEVGDHQPRLAL